jgi:hypothetical protein
MLRMKSSFFVVLLFISTLAVQPNLFAQSKKELASAPNAKTIFWREPSDIETRNLFLGAGGEQMKPDLTKITFIEDKPGGFSTKYRVRDASGKEWIAKVSKEAQPDTAANRLVWALGYETEIAYLVPKVTIVGKGEFENVRFEARPEDIKRIGNWMWADNRFKNTPEFQGLKIMMVLLNNWDIKDDNNEILASRSDSGEVLHRYIISDLGATFGKTGGFLSRSRNKPSDYVKSNFIKKVEGDVIHFNYSGKSGGLFENISVSDARWLARLLNRLSDKQIKDAFRSANYTTEEVDLLSGALKERIQALSNLSK